MLWWMWPCLAIVCTVIFALWFARGRRNVDDPTLARLAERAAEARRYNWIQ